MCCSTRTTPQPLSSAYSTHDGEQALDDDRRETQAELVEEEELRAASERPPHGEHLLLATGQQAATPVAEGSGAREVPVGEGCVEALASVAETQVFRDREPEEQAARLRYVRDTEPRAGARGGPAQIPPLEADHPLHRVHESGDGAKRRRLPRPVRA